MKRHILTVIFLLSATLSFAQVGAENNLLKAEVDTTRGIFKKLVYRPIVPESAISFNVGYGIPTIANELTNQDFWNKKMGTGLSFGVDYKYHFFTSTIVNNREVRQPTMVGLGVGLGISHFARQAIMDDHTEIINNFTDADGDICNVTLSYKGIKEKVSLTYLDIPLYLEIGKPSQVKLSGYFNVGVKASLLISGKFTGEGTYSSSGFYQYINGERVNLTLPDAIKPNIDALNYYTNKEAYENPEYDLSGFVLWGCLSGGINIPFSSLEKNNVSSWILRIGAKADYTILPVSKEIAEPYFKGANYRINQSNMLGGSGSRMFVLGLDVKLIYCF